MTKSKRKTKEPKPHPERLPPGIQEMELEALYSYVAKARREPLTEDEARALHATVGTVAFLLEELKRKGASIKKLLSMLFGPKTEKTAKVCPPKKEDAPSPEQPGPAGTEEPQAKRPGHGRNPASCYRGAEQIQVPHPELQSGDPCPECPKGRVYPLAEPAVLVRVVGMSPPSAKVVALDRLRCNGCGEVFKAPPPEGTGTEKYDATATSMVGLLRYGAGTPFYRLAKLHAGLVVPLPFATQWKLVNKAAGLLDPAFEDLTTQAAQGELLHHDDTTMKVLDRSDLMHKGQRKAVYTSGIIARVGEHRVALFLTGANHAGENLAAILQRRREGLGPPVQMCDALPANTVGDLDTIVSHCLAHARRRFVDVAESFPEECRLLLEGLQEVYRNDAVCRAMPPPERLRYHQANSTAVMEQIRVRLQDQLGGRRVEPHSGLGQAITYMLKHWDRLSLFLRQEGAPLDNNICEASLKRAILRRKNSLFYRTLAGARVGDTFMGLIHSAELNKANPFEYLVALQRYHALVVENPEEWMPWNYAATVDELGLR
jgi:hypothetical protein